LRTEQFNVDISVLQRIALTIYFAFSLSLLYSVAQADEKPAQGWQKFTNWFDPRTSPFIPIPEIDTDPNGGTTVGLQPVFLFTDAQQRINKIFSFDVTYNSTLGVGGGVQLLAYPSDDTQWSAGASATERISRNIDLRYSTGLTRQQRWSFDGRLLYDRDPTDRFFGLGNTSSEHDETNYTTDQQYLELRSGLNLSPNFQIALDARPRLIKIRRGAFDQPYIGTRFPSLPGLQHGSNELLTRLIIAYDTRDSLLIPTRGNQLAVFGGFTDRHFLSSVSYSLFGMEARHYHPLGSRFTLAGHLALRYMPVGNDVPFWALSQLGGDRSILGYQQPLRGFGAGRFVDNNLFAGHVELRTRVYAATLFTTHAVFELAPFLDTGQVFHDMATNPFSHLHPVGGIGFRGIAEPFVVGYVDVGCGSEGVAIFSGINYPF
jgi:outer membrane protein assembly factor BamA